LRETENPVTRDISACARTSIRVNVFAEFADQNLSDSAYLVRALGNPCGVSIEVSITRATDGHEERKKVTDFAQAGSEVAALLRGRYPVRFQEVYDGGPF
jgi:hypothetical protein